jgi:hypothetical protein
MPPPNNPAIVINHRSKVDPSTAYSKTATAPHGLSTNAPDHRLPMRFGRVASTPQGSDNTEL